jgi:DNA polymerase III psi subunit
MRTIRLPSPTKEYDEPYMLRLINALELDKQNALFSTDASLNNLEEESQAVSWFIG